VGATTNTPDKTFGRKGLVTPDMPTGVEGGEAFNAAVVQPDGKIVAAGSVGTGAGPATPTWSWPGITRAAPRTPPSAAAAR